MLWDIFCKVIDNHGDIGVCWRLCVQLAGRGERVRLWVDDDSALGWMAPGGHAGVQVLHWDAQASAEPGDAVVEAFGCKLEPRFQAALAAAARKRGRQPVWINLEYLSAESFAERSHGLPSPVLSGPAVGLTKHFFFPGFTAASGGLLREERLAERQARFDGAAWLRGQGIVSGPGTRIVSLFCYEPSPLPALLAQLAVAPQPTQLLVTAGRAGNAVRQALQTSEGKLQQGTLSISWLPLVTQTDFDHLLWASDVNFVRGEDSLVRALWAGRPFVWQLYPQHDGAHQAKLQAFLEWLQPAPSWRDFLVAWNGDGDHAPALEPQAWAAAAQAARQRLLSQSDLVSRLLQFVHHDPGANP